ncbi:MAG TPA: UvrD-helicase domain-containing protein [Streptosporangiaceae bacterium]|nr:UvrD-helicase domain-containing protein [Streptosporangiaceae bacterium]
MARLAIAKNFLAEYAKLDADARRAVEALVTEFARRPHAWRYLEKPRQGLDDRVRLFRVNSLWRGVVLAPDSGDTYCLVTILPHEKAFAYAAGHRFSVNQALGVLETRDEETIEQLRPALQSAARPDGRRLFGDITDEDLTRLGVDAQVLPVVRLLASEADLERLQLALPDAQYGALYALASGMTVEEAWAELARLAPGGRPPERVDAHDLVSAMERSTDQITFVHEQEDLPLILARPFAAWRTFLHPAQRDVAYRPSYAGPAQVTGGPGTGKTVTVLHRAAFLAARAATSPQAGPPVLVTTFSGNLAEALQAQLDLLIEDPAVRRRVEVLTVDRLAHGVVSRARGNPVIADEQALRARWAQAADDAGLAFTPAFLINEWEQLILARDLRTEQAYLGCPRTGRGRPLTRAQRGQVWRAAERVTAELAAARESTPLQLASEAAGLLGPPGPPRYRHILVDEAQDLHLAQWRLLRAAVAPGPDDLFIAADPHQRIYDSRVSLASLGISVRGRTRRLSLNYRTTEEILAWTVPLLGAEPVTGLDDEVDSLLGYRSPTRGQRPQLAMAVSRAGEFAALAGRIRGWLNTGIEPPAIGVAARSAGLARQAREALQADGIITVPLRGRSEPQAVRVGTMHAMKGLEFQAVAVIGVEQGLVPAPAAVTPEDDDAITHAQDLQRERCVLFAACTRARDQLFVSGTGAPSPFLPREARHALGAPDSRDVTLRA